MSRARDLAAFVSNADGDIKFDTDTLFIDSSANKVGIRTDSPDTELHIAGGANPTLQLTAYEGTQDCDVQILPVRAELTGSESIMAFKTNDGTSLNEVMRLDEDGNVGIGVTAPANRLELSNGNSATYIKQTRGSLETVLGPTGSSAGNPGQVGTLTDSPFRIVTNNTERLRVLSSGGITFNGDTAAANALDDYEEGTWTPVIRGSGTSGTYTHSGSASAQRYVKIGNQVTLHFYLPNIVQSVTGSGYLQIHGAPYTKSANHYAAGPVGIQSFNFVDNAEYGVLEFTSVSGSSSVLYIRMHGDNYSGQDLQLSNLNSGSGDLKGSITYISS